MTTYVITAEHYLATTQAVREAIQASVGHIDTTIECLSDDTFRAITHELRRECEDILRNSDGSVRTYYGADVEHREWRIRVVSKGKEAYRRLQWSLDLL